VKISCLKTAQTFGDDDNQYVTEVQVDISRNPDNVVEDIEPLYPKTAIRFRIDIEKREWGIKSMTPVLSSEVKIPFVVHRSIAEGNNIREDEEPRSVMVDLGRIERVEIAASGICTIRYLRIHLDEAFQVDYSESSIEVLK